MASPKISRSLPAPLSYIPFYYGWIILPITTLAVFISGPGQTYSISIFVNPIIEETGWSRSMVSGLYTAGSLTAASAMFLVGRLLDRHGARVMLIIATIFLGLGCLWMSRITNPIELYIGFAVMRLMGQGSLSLIPETLVALWFVRLRGRVMAINALGSIIGQATFPLLILFLISSFGWRDTWVVIAFIIWGTLILPAAIFVRRSPEAIGLFPDGDTGPGKDRYSNQKTFADERNFSLNSALRTRSFYFLLFAGTSQSTISTALVFHQSSVIASKGLDPSLSPVIFGVMAPMALFGNFLAGFLVDRFPNRFVLASAQVILCIAMLIALIMASPLQSIMYGAFLGLAGGMASITNAVIWPNYFGRKHLGSIRGIVTTAMVASAALGPWPFGILFDITGTYTWAILFGLALPITCAICAILATPPTINTPNPNNSIK
jgi:MFS family permease